MSELKLVSPLLDQMSVEEEIAGHNGCTCYALRHVQSGERFVVKRISVPASDLQVRALILSGAYPDDAAVLHGDGGHEASHERECECKRVGNDAQIRHSGIVAQTSAGNVEELVARHVFRTDTHATPNGSTPIRRIDIGAGLIDLHTEGSERVQAGKLFRCLVAERVLEHHAEAENAPSRSEYRGRYLCICFGGIPATPRDEPPRPYSRTIPTTYGLSPEIQFTRDKPSIPPTSAFRQALEGSCSTASYPLR